MSKVDLFIPTYNRPAFLKKLLTYYSFEGSWLNIFVIDSSLPEFKKVNKGIVQNIKSKKIRYISEFSSKKTHPHFIFGKMLKYAKSNYSVFCADDDFIIPSAIRKCLSFLEKNPSYVAAHGTYLSFFVTKNNDFLWKFIYPYKTIADKSPINRLKKHLSEYYQVLWSVRKTKDVKLAYKTFLESKPNPYLFGELMPDMATLVLGKMKRLPVLYSLRRHASSFGGNWPTLLDAHKNGQLAEEYDKFKSGLAKLLFNKYKIRYQESTRLVDSKWNTYLKSYSPEHYVLKAYKLLKLFPALVYDVVSYIHTLYLFQKDKEDKIGRVNINSKMHKKDFQELKRLILS